jgi:hypothetical protein
MSCLLIAGFMIFVWLRLYQQSHPLAFQGAVPEVRSTINLSDHHGTLQQAMEEPKVERTWGQPCEIQYVSSRKSSGAFCSATHIFWHKFRTEDYALIKSPHAYFSVS